MATLKSGSKVDDKLMLHKGNHNNEVYLHLSGYKESTSSAYEAVKDSLARWNLANFKGYNVYFEAYMKTENAAGAAYVRLRNVTDNAEICQLTTTSTSWVRVRSSALTMPSSAKDIGVDAKNSGGYQTSVRSMRLVLIPQ